MNKRCLAVLLGCIGLFGCSADYPLKAYFRDGGLYFDGAGKDWFFGRTGFCPDYFLMRTSSGETVWRIEALDFSPDCKVFPLKYGSTPRGWKTVIAARPLRSGELYLFGGAGGDQYHGAFRYQEKRLRSLTNDPEAGRLSWRPEDEDVAKALEEVVEANLN